MSSTKVSNAPFSRLRGDSGREYTLEERIPKTKHHAILFKGKDVGTGKNVIVKLFNEHAEMYLHELQAYASLRGFPFMPSLEDRSWDYKALVLEHITGKTLDEVFNEPSVHARERPLLSLSVFAYLVGMVAELQEYGIAHGDISVKNILLSEKTASYFSKGGTWLTQFKTEAMRSREIMNVLNGDAMRLIDFELARRFNGMALGVADNPEFQKGGGTPRFMAPEHIKEGIYVPRTETWPLGILGYTLGTGTYPNDHAHDKDAIIAQTRLWWHSGPTIPISFLGANKLVNKALSGRPEQRPLPRELFYGLSTLLQGYGINLYPLFPKVHQAERK